MKFHHFNLPKDSSFVIAVFSLTLFFIIYPLSRMVNFMQNDDWVYYKTVETFLSGFAIIDPYISATFYGQAYMGTAFAKYFGISNLPILTLILSICSVYIFAETIRKFFVKSTLWSIILSLFLLFNPFFAYSIWGFMTENYFLVFFIASLFFIERFNHNEHEVMSFIFANIAILLSYSVRQFGLVTMASLLVWLCLKRRFWYMFIELFIFSFVLAFHFVVLPDRWGFYEDEFLLKNLIDYRFLATFSLAVFGYVAVFILPLVVINAKNIVNFAIKNRYVFIGLVVLLLFASIVLFFGFKGKLIYSSKFYYFENSLYPEGFFRSIQGVRYASPMISFLFKYIDYLAKIGGVLVIISLIFSVFNLIKKPNFYLIHIIAFVGLLIISPFMYDRYLLILFPLFVLFYLSQDTFKVCLRNPSKIFIAIFIGVLGLVVYNYSFDFVLINNYIWNKGNNIVSQGVKGSEFSASRGWKKTYGESKGDPQYCVAYRNGTDKKSNINVNRDYVVKEEKSISFPLNIFVDSKIYLYNKIGEKY